MKKKISKTQAKEEISEFFKEIKNKTPKEIKKIKRLAMKNNISFRESRKMFCRKCLAPHKNSKVRIKKGIKSITCKDCGYVSRWKIK